MNNKVINENEGKNEMGSEEEINTAGEIKGFGWTKEQEEAITLKGNALLVSAGAGSGKTAVLVERIIRLITGEEPVDIDRLLVVTFTNAAAMEMKERIVKSINTRLEDNPSDSALLRQAALAAKANIMTIDSFCRKVVNENFQISGTDPSAQIVSEEEESLMAREAVSEIMEEGYKNADPVFLEMTDLLGQGSSDDVLEERIIRMSKFSESFRNPEEWIIKATATGDEKLEDSEIFTEFKEILLDILEVSDSYYSLAVKLLADHQEFKGTGMEELIIFEKKFIEELKEMMPHMKTYSGIKETAEAIEFKKFSSPRKFSSESAKYAKERIKNLRTSGADLIKKDLKGYLLQDYETVISNMRDIREPLKCFGETVVKFRERLRMKKKEKNRVSFSDISLSALFILTGNDGKPTEYAMKYREFFTELMIDEYQDSNEVQELILNAVSRDGENVFMVGDVKQSIYRFRQADPTIFLRKYREYRSYGSLSEDGSPLENDAEIAGRKILLYKNFRSRENIINTVNVIFSSIMSLKAGDIEYTEEEKLIAGTSDIREDGGKFRLEADFIDLSESDESFSDGEDSEEDLSGTELEARYVADRILRLVEDEKPLIYDKDAPDSERPLGYGDIVILLRSSAGPGRIFREALSERGIPCFSETRSGYFDNTEIRTVLSLLSVIDNPYQDIPLTAVLRSPVFGFTETELIEIRLKEERKNYYDCVLSAADEESELGNKTRNFLDLIEKWRNEAVRTPLHEFIWTLLKETYYYDYVSAMPGGEKRAANLKLLCHRASNFEKTSYKGLYNFIRYMDKLKKNESDLSDAGLSAESSDTVRIMSIHKSKGLEFPYVFLSNLGRKFNRRDQVGSFLIHGKLGVSVKHYDPQTGIEMNTLKNSVIKERINRESISEEMRILYVALTRAKERLFLTGTCDDREKKIEKWQNSADLFRDGKKMAWETLKDPSLSDWIVPVFLSKKGITSDETGDVLTDNDLFRLRFIPSGNLMKKEEEIKNRGSEGFWSGESLTDEKILSTLKFKYPHRDSVNLPGKVSVSMIKKRAMEEMEEEIPAKRIIREAPEEEEIYSDIRTPEFLKEVRTLTGAERGTAFHTVMMHINPLVSETAEIKKEIDDLVKREILLKEEAQSVNPSKILAFLRSPLGLRFRDADLRGDLYREEMFYEMKRADEIFPEEKSKDPVTVIGIIDAFFIEEGKLVLIDYKTDFIPGGNTETLKRRYLAQINLYREALTGIMGMPCEEAYLYSVSMDESVRVI